MESLRIFSVLFNQCLELEEHPRALLGIVRGPCGLRSFRNRDSFRQNSCVAVLQVRLYLPGARIVDRAGGGATACQGLAVNEVADRAHGVSLPQCAYVITTYAGTRRHWTKV
jgi:hypothetical protein